eukprot:gene38549-47605_t
MAVMAVFIFGTSNRLVSRQKKRDQQSHLRDPSAIIETSANTATKYDSINKQSSHRSRVEVTFKDLLFQVRAPAEKGLLHLDSIKSKSVPTRDILPRISGTIPAGKLSVMLGPTACGKSTLLNLLRTGGVGATSGEVNITLVSTSEATEKGASPVITERALTKTDLSKYVGYVPQDDILDRALTVRELLTFNTRARLPHIFNKIDGSLFLMDVAGNIVYEGPAGEVVSYLQSIGYVKPSASTAPADFCIDVLNGLADRSDEHVLHQSHLAKPTAESERERTGSGGSSKRHLSHRVVRAGSVSTVVEFNLASAWEQHCMTKHSVESGHARRAASPTSTTSDPSEPVETMWSQIVSFLRLSVLNGQRLLTIRLLTIRLRNTSSLITYFAINCIMAIALSSGFSVLLAQDSYLGVIVPPTKLALQAFIPSPLAEYATRNDNDFGFVQLLFFMGSTLGCASCLTAVPVFSGQL